MSVVYWKTAVSNPGTGDAENVNVKLLAGANAALATRAAGRNSGADFASTSTSKRRPRNSSWYTTATMTR